MKIAIPHRCLSFVFIFSLFANVSHSAQANENIRSPIQLHYPLIIEQLYQNKDKQTLLIWQNKDLSSALKKQLFVFIMAEINDQLLESYQLLIKAERQGDVITYDKLASDLILFYLAYNEQKKTQSKEWLFAGKIATPLLPPSQQSIDAFFNADSTAEKLNYLHAISQKPEQYNRLYKHLLDYYASIDLNDSSAPFTETIRKGEIIKQKNLLLTRLHLAGELTKSAKEYFEQETESFYTLELEKIIKEFQRRHGLKTDGVIGKKTQYWLNIPPQERLRLMALNTLRSEIWIRDRENMVLVNIPDYTMEYWEMGEKLFQSKVIVGHFKRKTPILTAQLDSIIFNPAWRVPSKIMRKDILPKALHNLGYFEKNQYEIFADWTSKEPLNINEIQWEQFTANNFPYKIRQRPGPLNALGQYKFNTPNNRAIYLHDTPAKSLFNKEERPFSSGCIRVEQASEFARFLLLKSGFSEEIYRQHSEQDKTSALALTEEITFTTIYQTVWIDDDGLIQFRSDIYQYDQPNLSQNVKLLYWHDDEI